MGHGSSVTYKRAAVKRQSSIFFACFVNRLKLRVRQGVFFSFSRRLYPLPIISPSALTTIAADRHFPFGHCSARQLECAFHMFFIVHPITLIRQRPF